MIRVKLSYLCAVNNSRCISLPHEISCKIILARFKVLFLLFVIVEIIAGSLYLCASKKLQPDFWGNNNRLALLKISMEAIDSMLPHAHLPTKWLVQ